MPDFFNAKALAAAQSRCIALERELTLTKSDLAIARQAVREMDNVIYNISQRTDWPSMRPYVADLVHRMDTRRRYESERISSVIYNELNNAPAIS